VGGVDERGTEGETDGGQLEESVEFAEWRWSDLECGPLNVPVPRPRSLRGRGEREGGREREGKR
jgi:hypothetical protein